MKGGVLAVAIVIAELRIHQLNHQKTPKELSSHKYA
jgi:hypothetical protein